MDHYTTLQSTVQTVGFDETLWNCPVYHYAVGAAQDEKFLDSRFHPEYCLILVHARSKPNCCFWDEEC